MLFNCMEFPLFYKGIGKANILPRSVLYNRKFLTNAAQYEFTGRCNFEDRCWKDRNGEREWETVQTRTDETKDLRAEIL